MTVKKSDTRPSVTESVELLTGYDEDKIEARFGLPVGGPAGLRGIKLLRGLHFANQLHAGVADDDAYKAAMAMTQRDLGEAFEPEPDDPDENDPDSDAGKGDSTDA